MTRGQQWLSLLRLALDVVECYSVQMRPSDLSVENPRELELLELLENPAAQGASTALRVHTIAEVHPVD